MSYKFTFLFAIGLLPTLLMASPYTYKSIAARYPNVKLNEKMVKDAKMEGECLVGLKELNFKKKNTFDAVAEWTNYRTISLLQHMSPCSVLIMMEVAKAKISKEKDMQSSALSTHSKLP